MRDENHKVLDARGACRGSGRAAVLGDRSGRGALVATAAERSV